MVSQCIVCADAVADLKSRPAGSIDLIITDPAYESLEKWRSIGTTTRLKKEWFEIFHNDRYPEFFAEAYRVLKPNTHLYVMCDEETMDVLKPIGRAAGFTYWKALVWNKTGGIGMGYHYRARHEFILFFEKGKRKLNDLGIADVLDFKQVKGGYPTEKPVELLEVLVRQSSEPGDLVYDPFMGSGATAVAAVKNGRTTAGCDISAKAVEAAQARVCRFLQSS